PLPIHSSRLHLLLMHSSFVVFFLLRLVFVFSFIPLRCLHLSSSLFDFIAVFFVFLYFSAGYKKDSKREREYFIPPSYHPFTTRQWLMKNDDLPYVKNEKYHYI